VIDPGNLTVPADGAAHDVAVSAAQTTTYSLLATNAAGKEFRTTASVTITQPVIASFTGPQTVTTGTGPVLTLAFTPAAATTAVPGCAGGAVTGTNPASQTFTCTAIASPTTYTATVTLGTAAPQATATVQVAPNPSTAVFTFPGAAIKPGDPANFTGNSCSGCTFVLTSRDAASNPGTIGNVNMNGGATLNLTAPGTGTYAGILIYQDRRAVNGTNANQQSTLNGNSSSFFQGAFYFPNQQVTFNGTAGMSTDCMKLVARTVLYSGNMNIANTCPANSGVPDFTGKKVRLVA